VEVAIGVDPAKGSLAVAAVDPLGRVLGAREFSNDPKGHRALLGWVRERDPDRVIGIECSLSYGASLSRLLLHAGEDVREVPTRLTAHERRRRGSQGKPDLVDSGGHRSDRGQRGGSCLRPTGSRCSPTSEPWSTTATSSFEPGPRWPTGPTPIW
jgi:Transposase